MKLNSELIKRAYRHLKCYTYHDNLNLFLKERVSAFECDEFDSRLGKIKDFFDDEKPLMNENFNSWLKKISYHILPKAINRPEDEIQNEHNKNSGLFLTNVTTSGVYQVSRVNYFINAPIELHIIEVLWCLVVAPIVEKKLTKDSYGNRMHDFAKKFVENSKSDSSDSSELFKLYVDQYNLWRDQAINTATELAKGNEDVALLSLDLKSYFYNIDMDFGEINELIDLEYADNDLKRLASTLTKALELICFTYKNKLNKRLKITHSSCASKLCLPIGFASSSVLANWYLSTFDKDISDLVRPAYYGRYVDDILMVFKRPRIDEHKPIEAFINHYLPGLLKKDSESGDFFISVKGNVLPIQREKLILQFFDHRHSRAGLEIFKKELEERSSAFKFLPSDQVDTELDRFAYDVLYDGSANKLRSIVGLAENETELAKYLSTQIIAHRLCKLDRKDTVLPQLELFFRGANALQYSRLWEKVYQYATILNRHSFIKNFYCSINRELDKVIGVRVESNRKSVNLTRELKRDLIRYNKLSLSLCMGLLDIKQTSLLFFGMEETVFYGANKALLASLAVEEGLSMFAAQFRQSNLIRHHLVAWPMANYSDFLGDLTDEEALRCSEQHSLNDEKLKLSPRFIHFDEWQIFNLLKSIHENTSLSEWQANSIAEYKSRNYWEHFPVTYGVPGSIDGRSESLLRPTLTVGTKIKAGSVRVALANIAVLENDISDSIRRDKKPNVGFERQEKLYQVLNGALREKAEILVMPEVAIPVSWLPFMVAHARRNQIGMIFGLELWVSGDYAFNLLIEALPFKVSGKYKSCVMTARLKNHYAPAELSLIDSLRLKPANNYFPSTGHYHKVNWNGVSFATYNCFELSDIQHRTIFKSEVDILFACVWNKDTNYYQHILESAVRDIHCYVVQSNTSQYGGSCVLRPTKTESKMMLYVKGGNNACVLTTDINIAALRGFQYKSKPDDRDYFKPLPPGFDSERVLTR